MKDAIIIEDAIKPLANALERIASTLEALAFTQQRIRLELEHQTAVLAIIAERTGED